MSNKKRWLVILGLFLISGLFSIYSCTKDTTIYIEKKTEITRTVSFSKDMVPVFESSCNTSGCHNTGAKKPDLTRNNAYNSLKNGNYINIKSPEKSEIYLWLTGKRAMRMPMGSVQDPNQINELTLAWIKQGSKKN